MPCTGYGAAKFRTRTDLALAGLPRPGRGVAERRVERPARRLVLPSALAYRDAMGDLDRLVPSGIIEQWVYHLRRQRSRATDALWLIEQGFTLHDGQDGVPFHDATERWRAEQETVVEEVTALLALYDEINLGKAAIA
jgi:hypothetical protein